MSFALFEVSGSHFEIGLAIGQRFAEQINQAYTRYEFLQQKLLPYHKSPAGQIRYQAFVEINQHHYPDYFAELEGLAEGAGRPFEEVFLLNLRGEYRDYFYQLDHGCFDCAVFTNDVAIIGHNEDGDPQFKDLMYLVRAKTPGKPHFTALSYPGFLCGNAFGFNEHGICFSVDNVRPLQTQPGLARHFVARSLLEARSLTDAIERVTLAGQASGFHYTIGSIAERRIVGVEAGPTTYKVQEIAGGYAHANHYLALEQIEQIITPSSYHRIQCGQRRFEQEPPTDAAHLLDLLNDESHDQFPIFGSVEKLNPLATLCTALFDLDQRALRIYTARPSRNSTEFIDFKIPCVG